VAYFKFLCVGDTDAFIRKISRSIRTEQLIFRSDMSLSEVETKRRKALLLEKCRGRSGEWRSSSQPEHLVHLNGFNDGRRAGASRQR